MPTYDELLGTVSRIADAAIEWDMRTMGWHKGDEGWISDISIIATDTYVLDRNAYNVRVISTDELHRATEFAPTADTDFRGIWRGWYERINDVFRPFLGLPDPADFQPAIDDIADAISVLNVTTTVTGDSVGDQAGLESANGDLDSALRSFCGEVLAMSGAVDTFAITYSNRLPGVVQGQLAILGLLGCNLAAEQRLFKELREDINQCAIDVLEVMEDQDSGGAAGALGIIGAVLAGASLFFTGGASAALIANGSTIIGILSTFAPEDKAPTPAETTYGAGDPMGVYENVVEHLDKVKEAVAEEERVVRDSLRGARREVNGAAADAFDLSARPALLDLPDTEIIDVNPTTMAFLGGVIAPFIGDNLGAALQQARQAPNQAAWERHQDVGLGTYGPYAAWLALHNTYVDVAVGTQRTLGDVGQKLIDVARLYVDVDDLVEQRQLELQGELDVPSFADS